MITSEMKMYFDQEIGLRDKVIRFSRTNTVRDLDQSVVLSGTPTRDSEDLVLLSWDFIPCKT